MSRTPSRPAVTLKKPTGTVAKSIPVCNTPAPKAAAPTKKEVTRDMISRRAYEISQSGKGGSEMENWLRAERELRGS